MPAQRCRQSVIKQAGRLNALIKLGDERQELIVLLLCQVCGLLPKVTSKDTDLLTAGEHCVCSGSCQMCLVWRMGRGFFLQEQASPTFAGFLLATGSFLNPRWWSGVPTSWNQSQVSHSKAQQHRCCIPTAHLLLLGCRTSSGQPEQPPKTAGSADPCNALFRTRIFF